MATAPPSGFNPTGVWLDHFRSLEEPPIELFHEFARRGGRGIILDGSASAPDLIVRAVEMVHELGLQAMVMVYYSDLRDVAMSKGGLEPIGRMIEPSNAVAIDFQDNRIFDSGGFESPVIDSPDVEQSAIISSGLIPEKPWLVLANSQTPLALALDARFPGERTGFFLRRDADQDSPFPSPQEARDSVAEWVKNLQGLEPVFYSVPVIDPGAPSGKAASIPDTAAAVREVGVRALSINSRQYADLPELREAVERLAWFPSNLPEPEPQYHSLRTLSGHAGSVQSVVVTPNEQQIVSGSTDETIKVWDLESGKEVRTLSGHDGSVSAVAVTPNGRQVVSGSGDRTIKVWELSLGPAILDVEASVKDDWPSADDALGFKDLVNGLDVVLNHRKTTFPLAIAVTAPWGAGKSSVMLQLKKRLDSSWEDKTDGPRRRWYTVEFPAWRFEQSERLWAALAKTIYEVPQKRMGSNGAQIWFRLTLEWSRLGGWWYLCKNVAPPLIGGGLAVAGSALAESGLDMDLGLITGLGSAGALASITVPLFSGIIGSPFKRSVDAHVGHSRFQDQLGFSAEAQEDIEKLMKKLAPNPEKKGQSPTATTPENDKQQGKRRDTRFLKGLLMMPFFRPGKGVGTDEGVGED